MTEKEARQERLRWEQQHRDLAKEIYEAALQGNFNDVTLQKINKYIDDATPKNPFGRRISQRVPQKMERSLHAGHRTNAVDALFTRISESAVGDAGTKLARNRGARERAKEIKKELLKGWAIATGNWHTDIRDFTNDSEPVAQGKDSTVYYSKDGRYVIKFSKGKSDKRFSTDIDAGNLFSFVFPSTAYDIVGYGEIDGNFVTILRQPVVDIESPLTEQERVDYMRSLGFNPINKENTAFSNGDIVVADIQKGNVVYDKNGNVSVLDADVKLHTKDIGGKYDYPPAATDTEQRLDGEQPKFQRDENSVIYGAVYKGKIYLNAERLSLDTPIHEYTHLWAEALRKANKVEWDNIVRMLKDTPQWEQVKALYPELKTDNEIAEETLAFYSGMRGAQRLREQQQKLASQASSVRETVTAMGAIARVKQALKRFWKNVADFLHLHYESVDEVADKVLADMLDGVNPNFTNEERSIMDKSKANGTWLKAPNGKTSKLSPKQWVAARTAGFKDKYGDWELANLFNRAKIAWDNPKTKEKVIVSLSDMAKARFDELLGTDIKQFIITDDAIRHIKNHHGKNEELRGQKNMTTDDILIIPYIINNFDSMELNPTKDDNLGNRAIEVKKRINGLSVVGTIEKGKNKEFLVTNFQFIKSDALDASKETPGLYVRNDSDIANVKKEIEEIRQSARKYTNAFDENGEPAAETVDEYLASQESEDDGIHFQKAAEDETDDNGLRFVIAPDGSLDFGQIDEATGLNPAPIRLSEGFQNEDKSGYGLVHLESNHGEQIRKEGFASVLDFVSYVAKHYDKDNIRVGKRRGYNGNPTYLIQVIDDHENTLFIKLSNDGTYWTVNSGGIFRKGYAKNKETVAKTEPQQPNNANSMDSSLSAEDTGGISSTEPNGKSAVSTSKDTQSSDNTQDPVQTAIDDAVALVGEDGVRQAVESTLNAKRKELENVRKKIADLPRS